MKCHRHPSSDAVGVCARCGRALCPACLPPAPAERLTCSTGCADALQRNDRALHALLDKSIQSAQASAFYCYLTGGLSAVATVAAWFMLPSPFLMYFTGACAVALTMAGFWHNRGARRQKLDP